MSQLVIVGGDVPDCYCRKYPEPGRCPFCESETILVIDQELLHQERLKTALTRAKELAEGRCACHGMYLSLCPEASDLA